MPAGGCPPWRTAARRRSSPARARLVSPPLVVIVANAAAGALLLTDAQIVGDPVEADPSAPPSRNNFYRVTLAPEVALPTVGSLLGGTGSKPLSGRVVAVEAASRTVTLEPVHPRALLPDLNVNEVIDLAQAEATINPEVAARSMTCGATAAPSS